MPTIDLSIITIGYISQETLPNLLQSINQQIDCTIEFIYVEHSPKQSSSAIVKAHYPSATILEPGSNAGFSVGCNLGAKQAKGEYLLFINPDCEIQTKDTLTTMLQFMREHPEVGICGPIFTNEEEKVTQGAHFSYFRNQDDFASLPGTIAWVSGAALMISKQLFRCINGFDERYFMYSEDVDICLTVRKAGFLIAEVANTRMMHLGGSSSKKIWTTSEVTFQLSLAWGIFTKKHYPFKQHKQIWKRIYFKRLLKLIRYYLLGKKNKLTRSLALFKAAQIVLRQLKD